ncbi:hypothetical protein [Ruminococcus flavefaciens]|uniref:hypothetical protein n=1 Tax=Ruminococcus flavefaciens TaxID=1265 RepID=UPI0002D25E34|nr:hypothetical protein [Ruminococcus flavefaciens]
MTELENYAELKFTNAMLLDIFSRYATNFELAEFVADDGSVDMKFKMINGVMETPKSCEHVLSLMFALFESNPQSAVGRIYMAHQTEILREVVYRLSMVLESFSDIRLTVHSVAPDEDDPSKKRATHTEFKLIQNKTKTEIKQ